MIIVIQPMLTKVIKRIQNANTLRHKNVGNEDRDRLWQLFMVRRDHRRTGRVSKSLKFFGQSAHDSGNSTRDKLKKKPTVIPKRPKWTMPNQGVWCQSSVNRWLKLVDYIHDHSLFPAVSLLSWNLSLKASPKCGNCVNVSVLRLNPGFLIPISHFARDRVPRGKPSTRLQADSWGKRKCQCCSSAIETRGLPSCRHLFHLSRWDPGRNCASIKWKWRRCYLCVWWYPGVISPLVVHLPVIALTSFLWSLWQGAILSRPRPVQSIQDSTRRENNKNSCRSDWSIARKQPLGNDPRVLQGRMILAVIPATSSSAKRLLSHCEQYWQDN